MWNRFKGHKNPKSWLLRCAQKKHISLKTQSPRKNSKSNTHSPSDNLTPMASFNESKKLVAFDKLMVNDAEENQTDVSLDAEQTQAIQNLDGPMLILASAGTGKTRTLMAKVAALLDNSVPTNEIHVPEGKII